MLSFKLKRIYLLGDCTRTDFGDRLSEHELVTPRSISKYHFSPPASFQNSIDGSILAYNGELSDTEELDISWCYQNGVPLVVWNKTDGNVPQWLRWHALSVFTRKERAVKILLTSLGLFEQA